MPAVGASAQNGDVLDSGGEQYLRGAGGAAVGLADQNDGFAMRRGLRRASRQFGQWQVDGAGQVAGREFLGLADIDQHEGISAREGCTEVVDFQSDAAWGVGAVEQAREKIGHGRGSRSGGG